MRYIYSIISLPVVLLAIPITLLFKRMRYRYNERLGINGLTETRAAKIKYWCHFSSLGEFSGVKSVAKELLSISSGGDLLLTVYSDSGFDAATKYFAAEPRVIVVILPFDHVLLYRLAFCHVKPERVLIFEAELWPALLSYLKSNNAQVYLVNCRFSKKRAKIYKLFAPWLKNTFKLFQRIFVADSDTMQLLTNIVLDQKAATKFVLTGSTKLDISHSPINLGQLVELPKMPRVTLSCIRPGEETVLFPPLCEYIKKGGHVLVAPRHLSQVEYFAAALKRHKISYEYYSKIPAEGGATNSCILLDVLGILRDLYKFSQLTIIGGTFINLGGHSPIEPAFAGNAIVVGPYHSTISDILNDIAATKLENGLGLGEVLSKLLEVGFTAEGRYAKEAILTKQGIAAQIIKEVLADAS